MKRLIILAAFLASGCAETVIPAVPKFPTAPEELLKPCPDLKSVEAGTDKLSIILGVVSNNYSQYHECRLKNDTWREWYESQRKIWDENK